MSELFNLVKAYVVIDVEIGMGLISSAESMEGPHDGACSRCGLRLDLRHTRDWARDIVSTPHFKQRILQETW